MSKQNYDELAWVEEAGRHLWAAIQLYRKHAPLEHGEDPDLALIRFLYELQDGVAHDQER